jgi:ABC-type Mn2+/Zn2+ transport system ATPase subunit
VAAVRSADAASPLDDARYGGLVPQKLDVERDLPLTGRDFVTAKAAVTGADASEVVRAFALARFDTAL